MPTGDKTTQSEAVDTAPTQSRKLNVPVGVLVAELVGTFILTAALIATNAQPLYAFFILAALTAIIGALSGAHLNPAITFAAWITRRMTILRALGYIVAQFAGAMLAFATLNALLGGAPGSVNPYTGQNVPAELFKTASLAEGKEWYALLAEVLGASILGFAVAHALSEKRERFAAGFSAGGGLFLGLVIAGTTAVLNPAVAVATQALKFESWSIAVYVVGAVVGVTVGFLIHKLVRYDIDKSDEETTAKLAM
ncbi:MAG TPA: aquaporin [Candidatus Saccharimonadales bacterium]